VGANERHGVVTVRARGLGARVQAGPLDCRLVHRDYLGEALASSPQPEPMPSEGEPYPPFDQLMKGVAKGVVTLLQRKLAERDERLNVLETEVVELKRLIREGKARDPKRRAGRHE
jgi:hypothetical protein